MISLERRDGRPLVIGHRGAGALAPENTLRSFRAAVEAGVDFVEFDVLALEDSELVVAHSYDLQEVTHGRVMGTMRNWSFARLREAYPEVPSLDEALGFFCEEARDVGIHVDLKVRGREHDVVGALRRFGVVERSFMSSSDPRATRSLAALGGELRTGITVPRSVLGITDDGRGALIARAGLVVLRGVLPVLAGYVIALSRASALVLHHSTVGASVVRRAHERGHAVVTWTVDDAAELARVDAAGVDAVVTNDPRIFASTLET